MAPKKLFRRHALGLIEVALKWLSATSNVSKVEIDEMRETLEQAKKAAARDQKLPGVAVGDLTLEEVETIFGLKKLTPRNEQPGDMWDLEPYDIHGLRDPEDFHEFSTFLERALEYLEIAHDGSTKVEAQVRARLDIILGLVLGFAKEDGRIITGNSVSWGYETPFWKTVRMKSREKMLRGQPDYALWYGAQANLETNLVIVEAKSREKLGKGERQLLGYMGLVHAGRIERGKIDTTVYGISTDSVTFNFYRINKSSKWCSKALIWGYTLEENKTIVLLLLTIMDLASSQSPGHSREPTSHDRQFSSSAGEDVLMTE
ncbi:uncharacterized protein N7518_004764 [Penicillium psychrosexuale]|uniref:uncharacterized protein n=1 Tax=Penicillium psychrosexuale TaxID=1002107 RepID=UPI002544EF98|nr:uncharacterized protein N7518_004764 [Penicillium psychrosexuale]KAJ5796224.1 hypothetical protein N7518_004764 [Penicillium psychrosexuale]